jgi:nucleoside-diphosphate-sugar epimerase
MSTSPHALSTLRGKVLITGATGFIGSRLCEVLALTGIATARAFVHSTAAAARITRFPLDFAIGDLCDLSSVQSAMKGCDAVVHLARGGSQVMRAGHENVLRAAVDQGVSRFVHISSVAVYGNNPPPESSSETAPAKQTDMEYGNQKLLQEKRVHHYGARRGLPFTILRPPNVIGPFSAFTLEVVKRIREGTLAIVDGGKNPCNLVYVDNLVEAILLALFEQRAIGNIFFVTDGGQLTWEQFLNDHAALLGVSLPRISVADLVSKSGERLVRSSLREFPRVMLSGELRRVLRQIPAFRSFDGFLYSKFQSLPSNIQQAIRQRAQGPTVFRPKDGNNQVVYHRDNIHSAQCRTVAHSIEKAQRFLGYKALVSYREGMELTEAWLRHSRFL